MLFGIDQCAISRLFYGIHTLMCYFDNDFYLKTSDKKVKILQKINLILFRKFGEDYIGFCLILLLQRI